jgi:hypothetical protein
MTSIIFKQEHSMSLAHEVVLINRAEEILADEATRQVKKSLLPHAAYLEPVQ